MGIQVEFHVADKRARRLPNPAGGFFDAAGDFDRLVSCEDPRLRLLGRVDPHGETRFSAGQVRELVVGVELVLAQAAAGAERRGLMRLLAMAARCAEEHDDLVFVGD